MNFFHIESLPHSLATMNLLVFLLFIAKTMFIAYLAAITGGTIFSIYYRILFQKERNSEYLTFSLAFVRKLINNLLTPFGLGIAPLFAIVFIYIQFSSNPNNSIISSLILTTIMFPIGLIFSKLDYFKLVNNSKLNETSIFSQNILFAYLSLLFLISSIFLFSGADISFINGMGNIGNVGIFGASFSFNGIFSFLSILSLGIAFSIINFDYFELNSINFVNSSNSKIKVIQSHNEIYLVSASAVIITLFLKNILLNYLVFTIDFGIIFILSLIMIIISIYFLKFNKSFLGIKYNTIVYLSFLLFLLSYGGSDSLLFLKSTQNNIAQSVDKYESEFAEIKNTAQKNEVKVNAEDIFFNKCVSCHAYDKNVVGPALNNVVKKYKGKKEDLKNFLLSPVKVDPNFPAMPNQGLKPAEAKAMADYLFQQIGIK